MINHVIAYFIYYYYLFETQTFLCCRAELATILVCTIIYSQTPLYYPMFHHILPTAKYVTSNYCRFNNSNFLLITKLYICCPSLFFDFHTLHTKFKIDVQNKTFLYFCTILWNLVQVIKGEGLSTSTRN